MIFRIIGLVFIVIAPFSTYAQDTEQVRIAQQWVMTYDSLTDSFSIPDRRISEEGAIKAKSKALKSMKKALSAVEKDPDDADKYQTLVRNNTNMALWIQYIEGDEFLRFMKRMLTSSQISQHHIHRVRDTYHKWVLNPTLKNLNKYTSILAQTGSSYEILCNLVIDANPPLRYVAMNTENVKELRNSTNKYVSVGHYYVWKENEGKAYTNETEPFFCITKNQEISLQELASN